MDQIKGTPFPPSLPAITAQTIADTRQIRALRERVRTDHTSAYDLEEILGSYVIDAQGNPTETAQAKSRVESAWHRRSAIEGYERGATRQMERAFAKVIADKLPPGPWLVLDQSPADMAEDANLIFRYVGGITTLETFARQTWYRRAGADGAPGRAPPSWFDTVGVVQIYEVPPPAHPTVMSRVLAAINAHHGEFYGEVLPPDLAWHARPDIAASIALIFGRGLVTTA